jgi:hypothetical protein
MTEPGRKLSGDEILERFRIPERSEQRFTAPPVGRPSEGPPPPGDAANREVPQSPEPGPAPSSDSRAFRRWPVIGGAAALLLLVVLAVLLIGGNSSDKLSASGAPRAAAKQAPGAGAKPRTIALPFRQLKHGVKGSATLKLRVLDGRSAHVTITASVPGTQYEVFLVKKRGSSKRLTLGRDGHVIWDNDVNVVALTQRYEAIEVLALRLPHRPGHGRVRSLRLTTAEVAEQLLHQD